MKPRTRIAAILLAVVGVLFGEAAMAQKPVKVYRVAYLAITSSSSEASKTVFKEFSRSLRDRGYVEGQNLVIDARWGEGNADRINALAGELVALKPDVIVAVTTSATMALKRVTSTIPIVMLYVSDPVGAGFATSLSHPGGNITGVTDFGYEMIAKNLEIAHSLVPMEKRIGVLTTGSALHAAQLKFSQEAAATLRLMIVPMLARTGEEIGPAFAAAAREGVRVAIVPGGPPFSALRGQLAEIALKHGLATVSQVRSYVEAGGLLSYGPNALDQYRLGAEFVHHILTGRTPSDLPIQQPVRFEMVVNRKTAKSLGITIPYPVTLMADQFID